MAMHAGKFYSLKSKNIKKLQYGRRIAILYLNPGRVN
jgi:hypothetical protein